MTNRFRTRLAADEKLFGTMVTLPTPATSEILADAGFDWLFIDGEHGPLETSEVLAILQAVADKVACLVRVPQLSEVSIKKILDLGAAGVIIPQVNTADQAAEAVRYSKFPPLGARGVGLGRANGYGMRFDEYIESANDETVVVVQAEHALAVDNIESIVNVPGIDAVLIGPYDLSASLGKMGQIRDPVVTSAIERLTSVCLQAGMPLGCFGVTAAAVQPFIGQGFTLIVAGVDTLFLGQSASAMLAGLKQQAT